jgi:hypothetical protein
VSPPDTPPPDTDPDLDALEEQTIRDIREVVKEHHEAVEAIWGHKPTLPSGMPAVRPEDAELDESEKG